MRDAMRRQPVDEGVLVGREVLVGTTVWVGWGV
jgi:hypothetical protein